MNGTQDRVLLWAVSLSFVVHALALAQLHLGDKAMSVGGPLPLTVQLLPPAVPALPTAMSRPAVRPVATKPRMQPNSSVSAEALPVALPAAKPAETAVPLAPVVTPAVAASSPVQSGPSAAVLPPRFDADYLDNPRPSYPALSRRLGEEGKVLLRVWVGVDGRAREVQVKEGSGFARLDLAARDAVGRWRFVPARRGGEAIDGWVLVPISFALN